MAQGGWKGNPSAGVALCCEALAAKGISGPVAIGRAYRKAMQLRGCSEAAVKSYLNGTRRPTVEFIHDLAQLADLPVTEVLSACGWIPVAELAGRGADLATLSAGADPAAPGPWRTEGWAPRADSAPMRAAAAVVASVSGASRFTAELSCVISGDAYPAASHDVVQFRLRDGAAPLPLERARELAQRHRLLRWPDPATTLLHEEHADYWATRLELRVLTAEALEGAGEFTWQGEPGNRVWLVPGTADRPRQLLVQDRPAGRSHPVSARPWTAPKALPLVFVGTRPFVGGAAALLAEALGWQFLLPHSGQELTRSGQLFSVRRSRVPGRTQSWLTFAEQARAHAERVEPWPVVVLVRPYVFEETPGSRDSGPLSRDALDALEEIDAQVVYARPGEAMLRWWANRQRAVTPGGSFDEVTWLERNRSVLDRVEERLRRRPAGGTLMLRMPEPESPFPHFPPQLPARLADAQPRLAWRVLEWLDGSVNRAQPKLAGTLAPGLLRDWSARLAAESTVAGW